MKRRTFIKKTAASASVFSIMPSHVLGFSGTSPNDKIQLGFIGLGKQGQGLMRNFLNYEQAVVMAASDVDSEKLTFFEDMMKKELRKSEKPLHNLMNFTSYRALLERKDIDAVVIATPDHWHAQMAVDAANMGKDIYCEKPLSSSVAEGRAMVDATRKYERVFQTGSMQRSWDRFRHAVELIRNGYIGDIINVKVAIGEPYKFCDLPSQSIPENIDWNAWIGPAPYRGYHRDLACPLDDKRWGQWRDYKPFGGGMVTDWGAHMFDIVQWALDMDHSGPILFEPPKDRSDFGLTYTYESGIKVEHTKWGERNNEIRFIGTEGRLEVSRSYLKTFPNEDLATTPLKRRDKNRVYKSENHLVDWLNAIRDRSMPICDVEIGHRTASICNIANIAYDLERPLKWDPKSETFENDRSASMLLDRTYRGQWNYKDF
ncbi:MAG: oxidoreductase [Flavobacteriaceae bacterium]|nr:oxidoreductase [Flavobacteriaceae bacterium]